MQTHTIAGFRLSPQQRRLWLLQQTSAAYYSQCLVLLTGEIQVERLQTALQVVIERHEILKTTFYHQPGIKFPIQVVEHNSSVFWQFINLENDKSPQFKTRVDEIAQTESCLIAKPDQAKLRVSLLKRSPQQHLLIITLPALYADSWTLKQIVNELSHFYANPAQNETELDEVVQYFQFSEWQNELLEEDTEVVTYWQQPRFSQVHLQLPLEKTPLTEIPFQPNYYELQIELELLQRVEKIAEQLNCNLAVLLLATWQTLLWRLTGKSDIVVGKISDGRKYEELQQTLGLFAKTLPIHCYFEANSQLSEIINQIQDSLQAATEWQDYFNSEQATLIPISYEFLQLPAKNEAGEVEFVIEKQYSCVEPFHIKLSFLRREDSLTATFHYDPTRFHPEDIQRLAAEFYCLLTSIVTHPNASVSQLEIVGDRALQQILVEFNQTHRDFPISACIHQLFESQVERNPNCIALQFEEQQLTYAELNQRANQLAHYLQKLGVKAEVPVAICLERSPTGIIALLAVLKAGGAYVPLDPAMPVERLGLICQTVQASILLTQRPLVEQLSQLKIRVVCLDQDQEAIAQENSENPNSDTTVDNLVYIIFTSGSTGQPKGVAVEHRQLLNYIHGIWEKLQLHAPTSFATVSTLAADLGNTAIFPALCSGGCLHVLSQTQISDPAAFAAYCRRYPIDCLKIVPSHLAALLTFPNPEQILPRRWLILGGETAHWDLITKVQSYAPNCQILNHYGPTETTVGVLTYAVQQQSCHPDAKTVPLGRPLANTQIYLLDQQLKPVPIGVPGEVYIAGAGLARGYVNQPALTAERFISTAFSNQPETRLYKTGDLARYLPDGNLEFLGRLDLQVKIRGFRIELGEIEAVLRQHPAVQDAVVQVWEERLAAYVVTPAKAIVGSVCSFLRQKLPEYMIPSSFTLLKALPRTPSGKVDRQALPVPDFDLEGDRAEVSPRNPVEQVLAEIWCEVLQLEQVSIHANFFDVGGHSLLATQVISRIRSAFVTDLPLRQLFEAPTIAELAAAIVQQTDGEALAQMLSELEQLPATEVQALLAQEET